MYGRSHSYSPPVVNYKLFGKESQEKRLILDCYRNSSVQNGHSPINLDGSDEAINVISPEKPVIGKFNSLLQLKLYFVIKGIIYKSTFKNG